MSMQHPLPWTWETHELSEGYSSVMFDKNGRAVGGYVHWDEDTAREITEAVNHYWRTSGDKP